MTRLLLITALASLLCYCTANTGQASGADHLPEGILAATLPEIADALQNGDISAEALVESYLARIQRVDESGPALQSVLTINPDIIAQARTLDAKRAAGEALGPLHGVPILLKDNIESLDNKYKEYYCSRLNSTCIHRVSNPISAQPETLKKLSNENLLNS